MCLLGFYTSKRTSDLTYKSIMLESFLRGDVRKKMSNI